MPDMPMAAWVGWVGWICNSAVALLPSHRPTLPPGAENEQRETRSVSLRNLPSGARRDAKTRFGGSLFFWRSRQGAVMEQRGTARCNEEQGPACGMRP